MTEDTQQGEVLTGGERTRDPYRLYVSNLPYETDIDMLKKKFSKFCVSEVELKRNGYGFVSFEDQENAKKAMNECNGTEYEGRKIKVDIAYRKLTNDEYAELGSSPKRNLYVSQLAESTDEETLRSVFEKFGELEDVSVFSTQKGGHFAFVKFANLSDADKARQNISKIAETDVKIQFAQSKGPRRGRGVFRGGNRGMRGGSNNITHEKRRLYISGLDSSTTEEILEQNFSPYGSIENVNIIREEESNRPRGFAFVTFSTVEEADLALDSLKGVKICNNEITVEKARVSTRGRGRGRGGFQGRGRGGFRGRGRGRGGSRGRVRKGFGQSRGGSRSENQPASTESEKPQSENVVSFEAEAQNWGSGNDVPTWGDESAQ